MKRETGSVSIPDILSLSLIEQRLGDDKLVEIAHKLPFQSLYALSQTNRRFCFIANTVARDLITKYFPHLKDHKLFQENPLWLFKTEYFLKKNEAYDYDITIEYLLLFLSSDISPIANETEERKQEFYALAFISGHQHYFNNLDNRGKSILLDLATTEGNIELVKTLFSHVTTLNARILLCTAAGYGYLDIVNILLTSPYLCEYDKGRALEASIEGNQLETFNLLLSHVNNFGSALIIAIKSEELEFLDILLAEKLNKIGCFYKGYALGSASENNDLEVVELLLMYINDQVAATSKSEAAQLGTGECRKLILSYMTKWELFETFQWKALVGRFFTYVKSFFVRENIENTDEFLQDDSSQDESELYQNALIAPSPSLLFRDKASEALPPEENEEVENGLMNKMNLSPT